ncbi:hypothetical protein [Bacillus sp. AK128]
MKQGLSRLLTILEYLLLAYFAFLFLPSLLPLDQLFDYPKEIREAKNEGSFFEAEEEEQLYFDRKLESKGLIYNSETDEASIILTSRNLFYHSIPNWPKLTIVTSKGETEVITTGGGSSSGILFTRGHYDFEKLPEDIISLTLSSNRYGESFSFTYKVGDQDE